VRWWFPSVPVEPVDRDQSLNPIGLLLICITVQLLILRVTQGRVLFIITIFIFLDLLLLMLLNGGILSLWALKHHILDLKRLLLLRYELGWVMLRLLWLRLGHILRCQLTSRLMTGSLVGCEASVNHLSLEQGKCKITI
jgi:hypothetical protein